MEAKDGSFGFDFAGTYTQLVQHKLIEYSMGNRAVIVEFIPDEKGVTLRVTFDAESTHPLDQQRDAWQAILNSFTSYVRAR